MFSLQDAQRNTKKRHGVIITALKHYFLCQCLPPFADRISVPIVVSKGGTWSAKCELTG